MDNLEELVAFVLGELDEQRAAAVQARVEADREFADVLQQVRGVAAAIAAEPLPSPSQHLIQQVKAAFAGPKPSIVAGLTESLRRVVATIVFDSRGQVAFTGFRGGLSAGYTLALTSDAGEVDLQVSPGDEGRSAPWEVMGQVSSPTPALVRCRAGGGGLEPLEIRADEYGMFQLSLDRGDYFLEVVTGEAIIELPPLRVG